MTRFRLYDGNGKERFCLTAFPGDPKSYGDGQGELAMYCKDGKGLVICEPGLAGGVTGLPRAAWTIGRRAGAPGDTP